MATCSSGGSRNHQAGERFARGETLGDLEAANLTAEGIPTVRAVVAYATGAGARAAHRRSRVCSRVRESAGSGDSGADDSKRQTRGLGPDLNL